MSTKKILTLVLALSLVFGAGLVFNSCTDRPNTIELSKSQDWIAAQQFELAKGKPFSTFNKDATTFIQPILFDTIATSGDSLPGINLTVGAGFIQVEFEIANPTGNENFWAGPAYVNGVLDTARYEHNANYALKHLFALEVYNSGGLLVARRDTPIYDAGDIVALSPGYPYHESTSFDNPIDGGFWLSARWVNLTTQNNAGAWGGPAGYLPIASLPSGDYVFVLVMDPNRLYGQYSETTIPFTYSGVTVLSKPFKAHGK